MWEPSVVLTKVAIKDILPAAAAFHSQLELWITQLLYRLEMTVVINTIRWKEVVVSLAESHLGHIHALNLTVPRHPYLLR